jgi:hypothetical protein
MATEARTSFLNWDFASQHVQVELANGEYVSGESTLVLGGPSKLDMIGSGDNALEKTHALYPIGLLQALTIGQNRQVARLFEVGSKRAYFVPGRLFANFQANRILFYGPSLMRLLYAVAPGGAPFTFQTEGGAPTNQTVLNPPAKYAELFPKDIRLKPGYGEGASGEDNRDFYISLASELFNIPFGLCVVFKDARRRTYGAFYLEDCMIEAHTLGVDANNVVIAEGVNGQFDMVRPIQVQNLQQAAKK